jgi:hypothetical protein
MAAAWVRTQVTSCGICGGKSGTGAGFLRVFRFRLLIFSPPTAPQSPSSVIWDWCNRPIVAAVPRALNLTPLRTIKNDQDRPSGTTLSLMMLMMILWSTDFLILFPWQKWRFQSVSREIHIQIQPGIKLRALWMSPLTLRFPCPLFELIGLFWYRFEALNKFH